MATGSLGGVPDSALVTASRQNCMRIMPTVGVLVVSATRATSTLNARIARYASRDEAGMKDCRIWEGVSYVLAACQRGALRAGNGRST